MNYNEIKKYIEMDKKRNVHPRNSFFIHLHRTGQYFYANSGKTVFHKIISLFIRLVWKTMYSKTNHIPLETKIAGGLFMPHRICVVLAGDAVIGENVTIMHGVTIGSNVTGNNKAPIIGDNSFIGAGAKIIGNCTLGENVIVGANSVVTKDIPANSTVVGINHIIKRK